MPSSADPFEERLEALFAAPPEAPDAETFAQALERRLIDEERRRRLVFGACTAAAGLGAAGVFALTGAIDGSTRALSSATAAASRMDLSWMAQAAPILGVVFVVLLLAELSGPATSRV